MQHRGETEKSEPDQVENSLKMRTQVHSANCAVWCTLQRDCVNTTLLVVLCTLHCNALRDTVHLPARCTLQCMILAPLRPQARLTPDAPTVQAQGSQTSQCRSETPSSQQTQVTWEFHVCPCFCLFQAGRGSRIVLLNDSMTNRSRLGR